MFLNTGNNCHSLLKSSMLRFFVRVQMYYFFFILGREISDRICKFVLKKFSSSNRKIIRLARHLFLQDPQEHNPLA